MDVQAHYQQCHSYAAANDSLSHSLQQPQQQYLQDFDPSVDFSSSPSLLAIQVEKQSEDIDRFIALQNERLRLSLRERRKQHQTVLLKQLESRTMVLLKQKEAQLSKAKRKTTELETCVRIAEMENQAWETVAKENESIVIALNTALEQVRESASCFGIGTAEDSESCCYKSQYQEEKDSKKLAKKITCKACNTRKSSILFLPCRHLCCCKSCESLLDYCPVCKCLKTACIHVFLS